MKKVKIDIDKIVKFDTLPLIRNVEQYVLLVKVSTTSSSAHSGILSFMKRGWDDNTIGFFDICKIAENTHKRYTSHPDYSFYRLEYNSEEYIAIKKPRRGIDIECRLISFSTGSYSCFIVIREADATNIRAL